MQTSNWAGDWWAIYDLETTGTDPETARVVQVALVTMHQGKVAHKRVTLCNPGIPIPADATTIHGITDEMVAAAPSDVEVLTDLVYWLGKQSVIVTYNGLGYDDKVMQARTGIDIEKAWSECARVDALTLVRMDCVGRWWKGKGRHRLGSVAAQLGIPLATDGKLHDAAVDAQLTGEILWALLRHPQFGRALAAELPKDRTITERLLALSEIHERDFQAWKAKQPKLEPAT